MFGLYVIMKKFAKKVNKCFQIVFKLALGFQIKKAVIGRIPRKKRLPAEI